MRKTILPVLLVVLVLICATDLFATGYRLYELGAKAATLAGAFTGRADNTSAIYYNPAGIAFQKGLGFRLNVVYYDLKHSAFVPDEDATYISTNGQLRGSLFVAYTFIERISIGVGYFQPYSMETDWRTNWPGVTLSLNSRLNTGYFRSVLAFKLNDKLSIGLGFDIVRGTSHWNYNRIFSSPRYTFKEDVLTQVDTSGTGRGFAAGILFQPSDKIGIGVRYQHKVEIASEGRTKFGQSGSGILIPHPAYPDISIRDLMEDFYSYTPVTSTIIMPAEFVIGIKVAPTKKLTFHMDVHWTGWSEFKGLEFNTVIPEEELQQRFYDLYRDFYGILPDWASQGLEMEMKDVWSLKVGVEYYLKDVLTIRAGYSRSQSSIPDEYLNAFLPVLPRNVISFGAGYDGPARTIYDQKLMGTLTFDLFVQYVIGESRISALPGYEYTYDSAFWVVGCGVGLKL
jgi:long-chain fatty acid transport protein